MSTDKPADARCRIDHLYYKIGLRGMVFRWNGREWVRANLRPEAVHAARGEAFAAPESGEAAA